MSEQELTREQAESLFQQKIAEQRRQLKTLSKNQLIRVVIDMSVRAFYQQAHLEELEGRLNENSTKSTDTITESTASTTTGAEQADQAGNA